jgi:hypothetical protein
MPNNPFDGVGALSTDNPKGFVKNTFAHSSLIIFNLGAITKNSSLIHIGGLGPDI